MRWREMVSELAGFPPLRIMEGFWADGLIKPTLENLPITGKFATDHLIREYLQLGLLPIKWDDPALKGDKRLISLLDHSDCDGELDVCCCGQIAAALEAILPTFPDEDAGGHIGYWRDKTQRFIDGLRLAISRHENVGFH